MKYRFGHETIIPPQTNGFVEISIKKIKRRWSQTEPYLAVLTYKISMQHRLSFADILFRKLRIELRHLQI